LHIRYDISSRLCSTFKPERSGIIAPRWSLAEPKLRCRRCTQICKLIDVATPVPPSRAWTRTRIIRSRGRRIGVAARKGDDFCTVNRRRSRQECLGTRACRYASRAEHAPTRRCTRDIAGDVVVVSIFTY